ncbi:MAG: polyferredoxin/tetratricopeptide (TPR) repeat protein [Planctomycetota bacterium]|jgi:polyferredoxin/tetratricopeptide (TPR) repeat protein
MAKNKIESCGVSASAASKSGAAPRKSKATRWRVTVLIAVHVLAAIHIAHWMSTGRTVSPLEPSEAMDFSKYSVVNAGLIFFALTIMSTLILGRWFCGWACHVVALQDMSRALLIKIGIRPRPLRSRWMAVLPLFAAFYMFFWPLIYRIYIEDPLAIRAVAIEKEGFWDTFPTWGPAILTFFVAGFLAVYFLGAKGFCTYACPYGAVFGVMDRVAPGRIRVTDACKECGHCTLTCTSNVDVAREVHDYGMVVDPGCMKCMDCVSVCPENALYFGMGKPAILAKPRQAKRSARKPMPMVEEVTGTAAALFGYFAVRGYYQERGFLLSVGIAACFAYLVLLVLRLIRRSDVAMPGLVLKKGGKAKPMGVAVALGTLGVAACAVPYGIVPEVSTWRASAAWSDLDGARARWFEPGRPDLSSEESQAAETLLTNARTVRERSGVRSILNTERLMWAELLTGDDAAFDRYLGEALQYPGAGIGLLMLFAAKRLQDGELDEAETAYRRVLEVEPGHLPATNGLMGMLVQQDKVEEALSVADAALAVDPEAVHVLVQRAFILGLSENVEGSLADLREALRLAPDLLEARNLLWRVLMQAEQPGQAEAALREGIALEGSPLELRAHLCQVLFVTGQRDAAVKEAVELGKLANGDAALLGVSRAVLTQAGATAEAAALPAPIGQ